MTLADLDPHWVAYAGVTVGMSFDCPHCRTVRIAVMFTPFLHLDRMIIPPEVFAKDVALQAWKLWQRSGDTFETITLTPSIDTSAHKHWHGHITKGLAA